MTSQVCTRVNQVCTTTSQVCTTTSQVCTMTSQPCTRINQVCTTTSQVCTRINQLCTYVNLFIKLFHYERTKLSLLPLPFYLGSRSHDFLDFVGMFRYILGQIYISVSRYQHIVFNSDADSAIFCRSSFVIGRNVDSGFNR